MSTYKFNLDNFKIINKILIIKNLIRFFLILAFFNFNLFYLVITSLLFLKLETYIINTRVIQQSLIILIFIFYLYQLGPRRSRGYNPPLAEVDTLVPKIVNLISNPNFLIKQASEKTTIPSLYQQKIVYNYFVLMMMTLIQLKIIEIQVNECKVFHNSVLPSQSWNY